MGPPDCHTASLIEAPSPGAGSGFRLERPGIRERLRHEGVLLVLATAVLMLSFARPALKGRGIWLSIPCWFNRLTGIPCLVCGMTRSFALTAHGRFTEAFAMHLLGPPLFFVLVAFTAYLAASTATGFRMKYRLSPRARKAVFYGTLWVFIACWVVKLAFMRGSW